MVSCNSSLSSEVAKPEPAVIPLVALTHLEYTPATPMLRCSLYAAMERRRTQTEYPLAMAASASLSWGIVSKALTKSISTCTWSRHCNAASSAMNAASHEALCAPMPAPPKRLGRELAASHALATHIRARIHSRIIVGNSPMGLKPPSALGKSTMSTKSSASAQ